LLERSLQKYTICVFNSLRPH